MISKQFTNIVLVLFSDKYLDNGGSIKEKATSIENRTKPFSRANNTDKIKNSTDNAKYFTLLWYL